MTKDINYEKIYEKIMSDPLKMEIMIKISKLRKLKLMTINSALDIYENQKQHKRKQNV